MLFVMLYVENAIKNTINALSLYLFREFMCSKSNSLFFWLELQSW